MSIRHVGIVVNNLSKMVEFYKLLGFEEYLETNIKGELIDELIGLHNTDIEIVKLKSIKDDFIIELLKYNNINNSNSLINKRELCDIGIFHLAFTVDNIDDIYNKLKSISIKFNSPPLLTSDNVKVCFCRDWEGNFVELVQDLKE
jgi:catechol 2,3-dioxygenase-like lactoylglutathione lyase family enzyme